MALGFSVELLFGFSWVLHECAALCGGLGAWWEKHADYHKNAEPTKIRGALKLYNIP